MLYFNQLFNAILRLRGITKGLPIWHILVIVLLLGGSARPVSAQVKVYVDLSNSGFTDVEKATFGDGLKSKFAFLDATVEFTTAKPASGIFHTIVLDNKLVASDFGVTRGTESTVYRKKLTDGHWKSVFDTADKQMKSLVDTAAHEVAHQFLPGSGHNEKAKNEATKAKDANGNTYVRTVAGNEGNLPNGKPGLMARGSKVMPAETAEDEREFTEEEKDKIKDTVKRESSGENIQPKPGGKDKPPDKQTDIKFISGVSFDPERPSLGVMQPFPLDEADDWLDVRTTLSGNDIWDFGFVTSDNTFFRLAAAGVHSFFLGFEPGTVVDFAIRQIGFSDDQFLKMSAIGVVDLLRDPIPAAQSVDPRVTMDYFREIGFGFDLNADPSILEVRVSMNILHEDLDPGDGMAPMTTTIPEPNIVTLVLVGFAGIAASRRARRPALYRRHAS
ncbi:MAG: hypothetical protein Q7R66_06415 [Undibacterium sp.]|uniref:hypothetical protein n=1 Tax=Undibacterium sp. TaxID=1914977 RepID=UPI00271BDB42|nr:hypothetical protein [Undibacterium sp.]MDO8651804.1 hypothetical protein [Undibacterium sp.]